MSAPRMSREHETLHWALAKGPFTPGMLVFEPWAGDHGRFTPLGYYGVVRRVTPKRVVVELLGVQRQNGRWDPVKFAHPLVRRAPSFLRIMTAAQWAQIERRNE